MDWGLTFVAGICFIAFTGAYLYYKWERYYFRRPNLFRTEVGLEVDDVTVYFPHIVSVSQEYVFSPVLFCVSAVFGFLSYLMFYLFLDFQSRGLSENVLLSIVLTTSGALIGYFATLKQRTVVRDSAGKRHILHLKEVEGIEFRQELTKDIWEYYKKFTRPGRI